MKASCLLPSFVSVAFCFTLLMVTGPAAPPPSTPSPSDQDISVALAHRLAWDPYLAGADIKVDVREGLVTLLGSVDHLTAKQHAAEIASSRKGVRSVINSLVVRPGELSDREISKAIHRALEANPAAADQEVQVETQAGVVSLTGSVSHHGLRELMADLAADIDGVRDIHNQIALVYENERRSNEEIAAHIARRLQSDIWLQDSLIHLTADNGVITLQGKVGSLAQLNRAVQAAWVPGVVAVDTMSLTIDPKANDGSRREEDTEEWTDAQVKEALEDAFALHPWIPEKQLDISVEEGIVTLKGSVGHYGAKIAARQTADNTVGVARVDDLVTVLPAQAVSDEVLASQVRAALQSNDYTKHFPLKVTVGNGYVALEGSVEEPFEQRQAEVAAASIYGIRDIDNRILVDRFWRGGPPEPAATDRPRWALPSDEELKKRIERELAWNWWVNSNAIEVDVKGGMVTLKGKTKTLRAMKAAIKAATDSGALGVVNEIKRERHKRPDVGL